MLLNSPEGFCFASLSAFLTSCSAVLWRAQVHVYYFKKVMVLKILRLRASRKVPKEDVYSGGGDISHIAGYGSRLFLHLNGLNTLCASE